MGINGGRCRIISLSTAEKIETHVNTRGGAPRVRGREWGLLLVLLAAALSFRMAVIGWGLPPAIHEVAVSGIRSSYSFDEDDILNPLSFTLPDKLDFDPRQYQWGTLHFFLVLSSLDVAEHTGYIHRSWRRAYDDMLAPDFARIYIAGRLVSVLVGLAGIVAMFFLALEYAGNRAAFWAASLVAVSPAHLLGSSQIRVDLTMTALMTITAWLGVRAQRAGTPRAFLWAGLAAGASVAAKYTAIFLVIPGLVAALATRLFPGRASTAAILGIVGGFLAGEPYMLTKPEPITSQIISTVQKSHDVPEHYRIPVGSLLGTQAVNSVRFLVGGPAALLIAAGLGIMLRRRAAADTVALVMLGGGIASLVPLLWPMLRYQLPLLPLLALAGAVALNRCRAPLGLAIGAVTLILPLAASIDQVRFMRQPHPANLMLPVILRQVPPGTELARLMPELPPLDLKVYPMGPNPLLDDLSVAPPSWILMTDLPIQSYPATTTRLLRTQYDLVARFEDRPLFPWATLGTAGTPHDWKYTHPRLALYVRRTS